VAVGRYVLVIAGLVATFTSLGIGWANVQWLAAAATVGLGFGLQEIFANFFSGLVMLAERPVRVGDVVTVDGITGRVTKIATRATQILDADNKEVIIPNKQFITGRIVNWTLDGLPLRHVITVAVELGSDLGVAERIMMQGVVGADRVLASPAPQVVLRGFTPGAVEFEVWFWVEGAADGPASRHDAIVRIDRMLREAGVRIASPQLDVQLRTSSGPALAGSTHG
jgi:potassium efflux system protein